MDSREAIEIELEIAAARREGVIEGLLWARAHASTVDDCERINAEIERLKGE